MNFAAESHVDRSILDPEAFLRTGVIGVHVLLDACLAAPGRPRFLQVSTDEVYGSVDTGEAHEGDALAPRSPYAAAKAAGELLVRSYVVTHGIDAVVTRGSNTYGPYHHPEKLIPLFITNAIDDRPLPLYGDGLQRRDWLYVADHADGVDFVLRHGATGETYNVSGGVEMTNRDTVQLLLDRLGKPWSLVRHVEDRPGHDRRYAMDGTKLATLGWRPSTEFDDGPGRDRRLVRRQRGLVARRALRRLGRLLRAAVRGAARGRRGAGRARPTRRLMRVAVTGATGRLGSALVTALADAPFTGPGGPLAWDRTAFDLDAPGSVGDRLDRDRPEVVIHAAAWTDVDGCAREPALALQRNGVATGVLASACARRGIDLVAISTNEVFDGRRNDGIGYAPSDPTSPANPYGVSKLAGERAATDAFDAAGSGPRSASSGPPGSSGRPAVTSRARSSRRPTGPPRPASRCGSWATSTGPRPSPRTSPTRSSACWPRTPTPASTTS